MIQISPTFCTCHRVQFSDTVLPMPDTATDAPAFNPVPPSALEVRAAAEALKAAIDLHLAAVESRARELDPAVLEAFDALAAAAEAYDELLYEVHDEVTPFEVPVEPSDEFDESEEIEAFSVLSRRDYLVAEPEVLIAAVRGATGTLDEDLADVRGAVAELFGVLEPDEVAYRAEEFGLEPGESTTWVVAADPELPGGWQDEPFADAGHELLFRVDTVEDEEDELFDEDEEDEDEEDADELDDEDDEDEDEDEEEDLEVI